MSNIAVVARAMNASVAHLKSTREGAYSMSRFNSFLRGRYVYTKQQLTPPPPPPPEKLTPMPCGAERG